MVADFPAAAELSPQQRSANLDSFETVWRTVRDRHPDPLLNGLDWVAVHDSTRPLVARAESMDEVRSVLRGMLGRLGASHYAIIPAERYAGRDNAAPSAVVPVAEVAAGSGTKAAVAPEVGGKPEPAAGLVPEGQAGEPVADAGKLVRFANLPEQRLFFESRKLPGGAGYIRFNEFLDPVSIMPKVEAAVREFSGAPGIVIDLRGNPGGIGIMAMGVAGFFVSEEGHQLGTMTMRDATLKFVIFPRPETYAGPLAVLVDGGSASTSEIFAQGMQDLGRARVFGTLTAGAALPSDIVRLPNGDGFQYAQASYTSVKGRVLEGNGVVPDVEVRQTPEAASAGRDLVIEAAAAWIAGLRNSGLRK